jgi:two-component system response regulator DesR
MRVLLVDARDIVHYGFRELLQDDVWVERLLGARSQEQAIAVARSFRPHVAVLGASLSNQDAVELSESLRKWSAATRVLIISSEPMSRRRAHAAGVSGVIPSTWHGRDIVGAARTVGLGMSLFAAEPDEGAHLLTGRELEVLELIGSGATNREIAERLTLSTNTIKDHTSALYRKMSARNRAEAVVRGQQLGLLA